MHQVIKYIDECPPVKGFRRSAIYDLHRNTCQFIPNSMFDILKNIEGKSIEEVSLEFGSDPIIDEYVEFLVSNEYILLCDAEDYLNFPSLSFEFAGPSTISSACLAFEHPSSYDLASCINQLENLGCRHFLLIAETVMPIQYFTALLSSFQHSSILSIDIYAKFNPATSLEDIHAFCGNPFRIRSFLQYSAPSDQFIPTGNDGFNAVIFVRQSIDTKKANFQNIQDYFSINMQSYCEAQRTNLFYNKKILIDSKGIISGGQNPSINSVNVNTTSVLDAINAPGFSETWGVNKDLIEVCRECEYRYMCPDDRIPVKCKGGGWKQETECFYNPFIAKWKGEEGYLPLSETREYLDMYKDEAVHEIYR